MKKLLSITLVLAMLLSVLSLGALTASAAYSGTWGDLSWTLDDEGTLTISGEGEMDDINDGDAWCSYKNIIKTVVIEDGVTTIGDGAFSDCDALESVKIPDSVTTIGAYAFVGCDGLTAISIPASVTYIGDLAFCDCSSLTNIEVNSANTAYCDVDGVLFNKDKTTLMQYPIGKTNTSYTIPDSVTTIGNEAFWYCPTLESVTIGNSITTIGGYAFSDCIALESVTIPDSVTTIGIGAFCSCRALESVTIPDSVTFIGIEAFYKCTALESIDVNSGNTVYSDVDGVLFNKEKTTLIQYPVGKEDTSYTIPDSVTAIRDYAFYECTALESVTIPDSVTSIDDYAFRICTALTSIDVNGGNTEYCDVDGVLFNKDKTTLVQYPVGKEDTSYTIPDSVTAISYGAFYGCTTLEIVYYGGNESQWNEIEIGFENDCLLNANIIFGKVDPEPETIKGDVDGDGFVDNTDALMTLKYDAGIIDLTNDELEAADVNDDGYADNTDALMILKYDAGIIEEL